MLYRNMLSIVLAALMPIAALVERDSPRSPQDDQEQSDQQETTNEERELKLKDLFPEKSFFGPSASRTAFSFDGRYATYLYRPYKERRHGNDLWLLDTDSGEVERFTSVVVMAEFQESTRKVKKDREKKARKAGVGKKETDEEGDAEEEADEAGPPADDPVSGRWEGRLTGGADLGIPPEGVAFILTLRLHRDGSVSGSLEVMGQRTTLSEGRFDRETNEISGTLVEEESGVGAAFSATIDKGAIKGTVTIAEFGVTLVIEGKQTSKTIGDDARGIAPTDAPVMQDSDKGVQDEDDKKKDDEDQEQEEDQEEIIFGNWVSDKDADDEKAPRYSGIQSYTWSPTARELIFTSLGDLYRFNIEDRLITRLTKTKEYERSVQYLPDGSGYTYMGAGGVRKIVFGGSFIEQLEPDLPGGQQMMGYELSPDGSRMVFLTRKVTKPQASRTVNIISYRQRFAEVRQVSRHVSDDELQEAETSIWLYDMRDPSHEKLNLANVYTHRYTGPRDVLQVPEWSPDSTRVAFAVFTQKTGIVDVYEAVFPDVIEESDDEDSEAKEDDEAKENEEEGGQDQGEDQDDDDDEESEEDKDEDEPKIEKAKPVYKFYHNGGPTTPRMIHPYYLADSRRMVFLTEQSGFRQLHILDPVYESLEQITHGHFEVYPFDISKDHKRLFITSTMENPSREGVYCVNLEDGSMQKLSIEPGRYRSVAISNDGTKALAIHETFGQLRELQFMDTAAEKQIEMTDSHPEKALELTKPVPEFFTYTNRHGQEIHGLMFKPDDLSEDDKRPLLIYVYGGPLGTRKQVVDGSYSSASYFFAYYMTKKYGYITCTIDPRGMSGYGGLFEKANFEQVGQPQVEDLVDGAKWFIEHHGVDPDRVGIHGWSFGGFQTQMCLYTAPETFAAGIAGAGPTEWENYNSWYSQGTIGETGEGTADLKKYSLLPLAKNLEGELLLVHGMEDSNVLYQDTVRVYRELLKAGKETHVELFLDPTGGHGLGGDVKTFNRYRKYEEFLLRTLGTADEPPPVDLKDDDEPETDDEGDEKSKEGDGDGDDEDDDASSNDEAHPLAR